MDQQTDSPCHGHQDPAAVLKVPSRRRWGFVHELRFDTEQEEIYQGRMRAQLRRASLLTSVSAALIWLLFSALDLPRLNLLALYPRWPREVWLVLIMRGLVMAVLLLAIAVAYFAGLERFRKPPTIMAVLYALSLGTSVVLICYQILGASLERSALLLVIIGIFMPLGLSLLQSLGLALACTLTLAGLSVLMLEGEARAVELHLVVVMGATIVLAATGAYLREHAQRQQFMLRRELEWLANRDPLTGIYNRRMFKHQLDALIALAQRERQPLALLLIDVDHFKLYNDYYGHQMGDEALRTLAQLLHQLARRPLDMAARVGGEEMALIFYGSPAAGVQELGQELIEELRRLAIPHAGSGTAPHMTVSVGCAMWEPGYDSDSLYQRADVLLYQAKHGGRNRIVCSSPLT
ncbi:diguanylate cyclase (GGDEF)-like protein [Paucibacter oligotrophus]|uniref:diguanylate cyclase n=1 Tax=Roseateles oligotrophus TaxID=1769250 RepID=A0A840L580_9BURK|nr:GGDEF domain-containing protein [Roseateles oligotrophus]MBB4843360.1 diguanylate cyclase (GGDEF)-like protein [Roseateles oligotrophus]